MIFETRTIIRAIVVAAATAIAAIPSIVQAQNCDPHWTVPMFQNAGINDIVRCTVIWDGGNSGGGPAIYAAGDFTNTDGIPAARIAKWDGNSGGGGWSSLGAGLNGPVHALAVFDDGLGDGPVLFVGGTFTTAGGIPANRIARWDGTNWSALGAGVNESVFALLVYDDGTGPALYAGGAFGFADGVSAPRIARWNGSNWSAVGTGMSGGNVEALTAFDDGTGMKLIAGGTFTGAGGSASRLAAWDGTTWSKLGNGVDGTVVTLASVPIGGTPRLFIGGFFLTASGATVNRIVQWNGNSYSPLITGVNNTVRTIIPFEQDGKLYAMVGGQFTSASGTSVRRIALWDGASWAAPATLGPNNSVFSLLPVQHEDAAPGVIVSGLFTSNGVQSTGRMTELRPGEAPHILAQPSDSKADAGEPVGFAVLAAPGGTVQYEWRRDGEPIDELEEGVSGTDSPALTIASAAPAHAGVYDVRIMNACGEAVSEQAMLIVNGTKTPETPGDLNGDGHVNVLDLLILLGNWGPCPQAGPCPADLNNSGAVDVQDLLILLGNWG